MTKEEVEALQKAAPESDYKFKWLKVVSADERSVVLEGSIDIDLETLQQIERAFGTDRIDVADGCSSCGWGSTAEVLL